MADIKKIVFISSRIGEMREFREAAIQAIEDAGMKPIFYDSTDPQRRWEMNPLAPIMPQLLEGVRSADVFLGLYGCTLADNWKAQGYKKRSMELEFEAADEGKLPRLFYVKKDQDCLGPDGQPFPDKIMARLRKRVLQWPVGFLTTPAALYNDLLEELKGLKPRIFLSYSTKDKAFANELYSKLRASGLLAWYNTVNIPGSTDWHDEMTRGLVETEFLLLILSPDAVKSQWVLEELQTYSKAGKIVLPINYRECKLPDEISHLNMFNPNDPDWYYKLLNVLKNRLNTQCLRVPSSRLLVEFAPRLFQAQL